VVSVSEEDVAPPVVTRGIESGCLRWRKKTLTPQLCIRYAEEAKPGEAEEEVRDEDKSPDGWWEQHR
jgi:hypothetical protein